MDRKISILLIFCFSLIFAGGKTDTLKVTGAAGIGTTAPSANLDVLGTARFGDHTTNYSNFESDGTLHFTGSATTYNDLYTGIAAAKVPSHNFPTWAEFSTNLANYTFAINNYADLSTIEILHDYKEGTNIEIHLHLATNGNNNATPRTARYVVYYSYGIPDNGTHQFTNDDSLVADLTIAANIPTKSVYYLTMGTITGTSMKIGTQLKTRIKRKSSGGTEPIDDPFLCMVGVHYERDTFGSRTTQAK